MHASKTICSKPNKQIKNSVDYSLQILWRGTKRLKTMLASPVFALLTCVILPNLTLAVMLRHARKCKHEQYSCVPACFQRVIICNYFYFLKRYLSVTALAAAFPLLGKSGNLMPTVSLASSRLANIVAIQLSVR